MGELAQGRVGAGLVLSGGDGNWGKQEGGGLYVIEKANVGDSGLLIQGGGWLAVPY